jgi:ankyrin repeat protein
VILVNFCSFKTLLRAGVDVNFRDDCGKSAIDFASKENRPHFERLLRKIK